MARLIAAGLVTVLWATAATGQVCEGDFNSDKMVTVDEIVTSVNNALGGCPAGGHRFTDNGNGTITDRQTGLQWEKKSDDGSIHDWENLYTWTSGDDGDYTDTNGTAFTVFLATLNTPPCFAGHCDWRLPTRDELSRLVDDTRYLPAIYPPFHTNCASGCGVTECSCTQSKYYWSATTYQGNPTYAWNVGFYSGSVDSNNKTSTYYVRGVRGGS